MTTMKIRSTLLAAASVMMLAGGVAMAAQPNHDVSSTEMTTLSVSQPNRMDASVNKRPLPWYESGFTSRAQLRGQIQSEQFDFGDNG